MLRSFLLPTSIVCALISSCLGIHPVYQPDPAATCDENPSRFGGGSGTSDDPFKICTRGHLAAISGSYLSNVFIQLQNIDLGGASYPWSPIASSFTGRYEGNYKTISGLYYNTAAVNDVGLFKIIGTGGVVRNLTLSGVSITGTGTRIGGLVGRLTAGTVYNSHVSGTISAASNAGGLIGQAETASAISYSTTNVTLSGSATVGGLIGRITNDTTITFSSASGSVTGSSADIGGLIGSAAGTGANNQIQNCRASGVISALNEAGGLIGYATGMGISKSYATGAVSASFTVGGLIGFSENNSQVSDSFATGNAAITFQEVGGLIGYCESTTILRSYSTGQVTGASDFGGLIGLDDGGNTFTNSYWDTVTSGQAASPGGTGLTTAQMKDFNNFTGWNFSTIWNGATYGGSAADYPFLR